VLLLDEADVYLIRRSNNSNYFRNSVVSLFLRKTEYYPGIIIMTSNRDTNLDPAITSRVTLPLLYPDPNEEDNVKTWWRILFRKATGQAEDRPKGDEAGPWWSGRQIRTAFRFAVSLAINESLETIGKLSMLGTRVPMLL
jgi:ATPase family associated with various cellular activities (AAA)